MTRIRWPHGTGDLQFFEKNLPSGAPSWLRSVTVPSTGSRGGGDTLVFPVIEGLADLTYFANLASLELHVHQWTVGPDGRPQHPNRMVIDLDPGSPAGLRECSQVALMVRDKLAERGLSAAPVTSGSKGLHVYAALPGRLDADAVRDEAQEIARELTAEHPGLVLWKMTKSLRGGKVFLDWSQNTGAEDDHLAVLAARPGPALRGRPAHLGGDRGRRRGGPRPAGDGRRAGPGGRARRHLRRPARGRLSRSPPTYETRRSRETAAIRIDGLSRESSPVAGSETPRQVNERVPAGLRKSGISPE